MKVFLIGADGQLGTDLWQILSDHQYNIIPSTIQTLNITNLRHVLKTIEQVRPDIVISTAGETDVDACEDHPTKAFEINAMGTRNIALACRKIDRPLMVYSTDYIFDGQKKEPYLENDTPHALNIYGASKLAGEYLLKSTWDKHFILRTGGLYGHAGRIGTGENFVKTMIDKANKNQTIRVVNDQIVTPTYTVDLAQKSIELLQTNAYGTYHATNTGECSWFDFAQNIFQILNIDVDLHAIESKTLELKAKRPPYSVLENQNLRKEGLTDFRHWKEALTNYLTTWYS